MRWELLLRQLAELLQFLLEFFDSRPGTGENFGLGVELLATHHVEPAESGLHQSAHAFVDFALDTTFPDKFVYLSQDVADWRGFYCHEFSLSNEGRALNLIACTSVVRSPDVVRDPHHHGASRFPGSVCFRR